MFEEEENIRLGEFESNVTITTIDRFRLVFVQIEQSQVELHQIVVAALLRNYLLDETKHFINTETMN